jgi:hypothetical protein
MSFKFEHTSLVSALSAGVSVGMAIKGNPDIAGAFAAVAMWTALRTIKYSIENSSCDTIQVTPRSQRLPLRKRTTSGYVF